MVGSMNRTMSCLGHGCGSDGVGALDGDFIIRHSIKMRIFNIISEILPLFIHNN